MTVTQEQKKNYRQEQPHSMSVFLPGGYYGWRKGSHSHWPQLSTRGIFWKGDPSPGSWTGAAFGFPMQSQWDYDYWPTPCQPGQAVPLLWLPYPQSGQLWVSNTDSAKINVSGDCLYHMSSYWGRSERLHLAHTTPQISGLDRGGDMLNVYFQNFL